MTWLRRLGIAVVLAVLLIWALVSSGAYVRMLA
jgi:hypothetical protein